MNLAPTRSQRSRLAVVTAALAGPLLALAAIGPVAAGPPASAEFRVNTFTTSHQSEPAIAMDADGDYVVVWASIGQDGSSYGIYLQRYNAAGVPQGGETLVNTTTADSQREPSVAMDADGDFVVTWSSNAQDGSEYGVYFQRFNAAGVPQGVETRANTVTANHQSQPSVAMDADGDFVITWSSNLQDLSSFGIYFQRFNAAGVPQGAETRANDTTDNNQAGPSVAMDADGDFVIAWYTLGQDLSAYAIYAKRYSANGLAADPESRVNTTTANSQVFPSVAMAADGSHIVTWESQLQDGSENGIYAQRYNAAGVPRGTETPVNTTTVGDQAASRVVMDADGDAVIAWTSEPQDGGGSGVYAQRFDATGAAQGLETLVNTTTANSQSQPSLAMDADGDFVAAWTSSGQDGSGSGIYARRYRGPESVDLSLWQSDNVDPVGVGGRVVYRIRVANLHDEVVETGVTSIDSAIGSATGVYVVVTPPEGAGVVLPDPGSGWTCGPALPTRCRLSVPLAPGAVSPALVLTTSAPSEAGPALLTARVHANQLDPVPANDYETERTNVLCTFGFSDPSFTVAEAGSLVVGVNRTGTNCGSASVQYETASGTASAGDDFDDVSDTLTFEDGDVAGSFSVPIVADLLDEKAEQLKLRLTNPVDALLGRPALVNATITDNDLPPRVNFTTSGATVSEPGALVEVTLRLSEVSGQPVTVTLSKTGAATSGADYFAPAKATIPAGQRTVSFDVEIADDLSVEASEAANITLSSPVNATLGSLKTFRLVINDDD